MKIVFFGRSLLTEPGDEAHFLRGIAGELCERGSEVVFYEPERSAERREHERGAAAAREALSHASNRVLRSGDFRPGGGGRSSFPRAGSRALGARRRRGARKAAPEVARLGALLPRHPSRWVEREGGALAGSHRIRRHFGLRRSAPRTLRQRGVGAPCVHVARGGGRTDLEAGTRARVRSASDGARGRGLGGGRDGDSDFGALARVPASPLSALRLGASAFGARYSSAVILELKRAGIDYLGTLPNHRLPEVFRRHRVALHVPGLRTRICRACPRSASSRRSPAACRS